MAGQPLNYAVFQGVTIEVFKARNVEAIHPLKKFLTVLPSPSYIKTVLLQAIYQLAEQEPEIARWVLQHHQYLEPELKLIEVAQQVAIGHLQSQGLIFNQDFSFTADHKLEASRVMQSALLEVVSVGDRLLIEEILFMH